MRLLIAAAVIATALIPAVTLAQDSSPKGPPKTMGDEGKLPATGTMSGRTPEMGATGAGSGTSGTPGTGLRMGDDGKLPATGSMSGATPKMNAPAGENPK